MSYTFHAENGWVGDPDQQKTTVDADGHAEEAAEVGDPTGMTGTLDTSGTSGVTETAEDVSDVFAVADAQSAENQGSEETLGAADGTDLTEAEQSIKEAGQTAEENEAEADAKVEDAAEPEPAVGDENKFDGRKNPDEYTVKEVVAYFATATDAQKAKVQAKEAKGQNRAGIMNA